MRVQVRFGAFALLALLGWCQQSFAQDEASDILGIRRRRRVIDVSFGDGRVNRDGEEKAGDNVFIANKADLINRLLFDTSMKYARAKSVPCKWHENRNCRGALYNPFSPKILQQNPPNPKVWWTTSSYNSCFSCTVPSWD